MLFGIARHIYIHIYICIWIYADIYLCRVIGHWNILPRDVAHQACWSSRSISTILSDIWFDFWIWTWWSLGVPSNLGYGMILESYELWSTHRLLCLLKKTTSHLLFHGRRGIQWKCDSIEVMLIKWHNMVSNSMRRRVHVASRQDGFAWWGF